LNGTGGLGFILLGLDRSQTLSLREHRLEFFEREPFGLDVDNRVVLFRDDDLRLLRALMNATMTRANAPHIAADWSTSITSDDAIGTPDRTARIEYFT